MSEQGESKWKVIDIKLERYVAGKERLTCTMLGPNDARLVINPEVPSNYMSMTLSDIEDLAFEEAKKLYPR